MQMPEFTTDWFSPNIPQWKSLFDAMAWDPDQPKTVIEIGSFEGRSTLWILEHLLRHPDSRIHCIDTFAGGMEHDAGHTEGLYDRFRANLATAPGERKALVHREPSGKALIRLAAEGVLCDFAYVDGSHQAPDVLSEARKLFSRKRPIRPLCTHVIKYTFIHIGKN
jgi:predicted O-methyltransferase YrrM